MVVTEVEVIRQYDIVTIVVNPDTIYIFVKKMKKYLIYIVLIDLN